MAMVIVSTMGFLIADGEVRRVRWIQAMRRCLVRFYNAIRYERPSLIELLEKMDLSATREERELTKLLHVCAHRMTVSSTPQLVTVFSGESAGTAGYGILSAEDRQAFECVLSDLGHTGLDEQLRLLDAADERLRAREETLRKESGRRAQLIRALGLTGGAAIFLLLI